jgi:hypothetical protein
VPDTDIEIENINADEKENQSKESFIFIKA